MSECKHSSNSSCVAKVTYKTIKVKHHNNYNNFK
nr:MAG TPA: hypothetical protein [Caudoviricetes sp.]